MPRMLSLSLVTSGLLYIAMIHVSAYPSGAPVSQCIDMQPSPGSHGTEQTSPSPYALTVDSNIASPGSSIVVTLESCTESMFRGILLEAWMKTDGTIVGSFSSPPGGFKTIHCSGASSNSAVTHSNADDKSLPQSFTFNLPSDLTGEIKFLATVVKVKKEYWRNIMSNTEESATACTSTTASMSNTTSTSQIGPDCLKPGDDPCNDNYEELNDPDRSTNYNDQNAGFLNDYFLSAGWYRSVSLAGGDMPTTPPTFGYCQATNPIWINGRLPAVEDGVVVRKACAVHFATQCHREYEVCIKNCQDYNVYYLPTVEAPTDRYCFGSEVKCPEGQSSPNGFTPGCTVLDPCESAKRPPCVRPEARVRCRYKNGQVKWIFKRGGVVKCNACAYPECDETFPCLNNPCQHVTCPEKCPEKKCKEAKCVVNQCGGCNAVWVDRRGKKLPQSCDCVDCMGFRLTKENCTECNCKQLLEALGKKAMRKLCKNRRVKNQCCTSCAESKMK